MDFRSLLDRAQNTRHDVRAHWAVATLTNVLGGKADQNLGSLPPKLRVLFAVFFQRMELVLASLFAVYASRPQNARGLSRPEHCG